MTNTYTYTNSQTFTWTHAKRISYRVATDLKRLQRLYGCPEDYLISMFDKELVILMLGGYIETVTYGYRRNNLWIEPTLRFTASELNSSDSGDDPGRIQPGADVTGAGFCSYLNYSNAWRALSPPERAKLENSLPFTRTDADEPRVNGYWQPDLCYSAGGRGLQRATVRSSK